MKKILFAASEAVPFIKTGGLADVVGSLPGYFDKDAYDVRVILPKYACMEEKWKDKLKLIAKFYVKLGWRQQYVGLYETEYKGIHYYFVDNEFYFAGPSPYGPIHEDVEKFAYFSKAVVESLQKLDFVPDIVHCHDWQAALIPVYMETLYGNIEFYQHIKTVFSIHNILFQGRWRLNSVQDATGLPEYLFTTKYLEAYGESNYMKGAIVFADAVTTVSKSYAMEIMTQEGGAGLDGVLRKYSYKLFGIMNGLDYDVFHPGKDTYISYHYDKENAVQQKAKQKAALQKKLGLPVDEDVFLLGMISRMSDQKGFDLVACVLEELLQRENLQMVVLGSGEERYQNMFRYFSYHNPQRLSATIRYTEQLAHKIYAACDGFLMPSLTEPCGLCQLISLRYGTVPIVRETGGLRDTVTPYNKYLDTGTGFSFANYNAHEMKDAVLLAMDMFYHQKEEWEKLMARGMEADFSWKSSVAEYRELYRMLSES